MYWAPVVLFPTLLYGFFGIAQAQGQTDGQDLLLASWSAFAVIGVAFFQFGVGVATARQSKWEDFARTLPVGAGPRLVAQMVAATVFSLAALGLLWLVSRLFTNMTPSLAQYVSLLGALALGIIPFVCMGVAIGYAVPPRAAVPVANLFYLPLSYFGGLWVPPSSLPEPVARVSVFTPTRQLGELAWAAIDGRALPFASIELLLAYGGVAGALALILWRRDATLRTR